MFKTLFTGWRLWMTLLVIVGVAVLCRLGIWQLDRLAERRARNDLINARMAQPPLPLTSTAIDPAELEYRRVEVRGVYDPSQEILLRNRALDEMPGVHIITPLRLDGSNLAVLVDRGWIPRAQEAPEDRHIFAEPGEKVIQGIARLSQEVSFGPQDPPLGPDRSRLDAWFYVNIPRIQQQITGYRLLPIFIEQQPAPGDPTLPRRLETTDLGAGSHLSYAIQWFSFAIILLVGYLAWTFQQTRRNVDSEFRKKGEFEGASPLK